MTVEELRNRIKDVPDDAEIKIAAPGGFAFSADDAEYSEDVDKEYNEIPDKKVLWIYH